VIVQSDAKRLAKPTRSGAQEQIGNAAASLSHSFQSFDRLRRLQQDPSNSTIGMSNGIQHDVYSIALVNVGDARRSNHRQHASASQSRGV